MRTSCLQRWACSSWDHSHIIPLAFSAPFKGTSLSLKRSEFSHRLAVWIYLQCRCTYWCLISSRAGLGLEEEKSRNVWEKKQQHTLSVLWVYALLLLRFYLKSMQTFTQKSASKTSVHNLFQWDPKEKHSVSPGPKLTKTHHELP